MIERYSAGGMMREQTPSGSWVTSEDYDALAARESLLTQEVETLKAEYVQLEMELAADNDLFQQRWREWQGERDDLVDRVQWLEAALREIAAGFLPDGTYAGRPIYEIEAQADTEGDAK